MENTNKWKNKNNIVNKYIYIMKICCYFMPLWIAPQGQTVLLTLNTSSSSKILWFLLIYVYRRGHTGQQAKITFSNWSLKPQNFWVGRTLTVSLICKTVNILDTFNTITNWENIQSTLKLPVVMGPLIAWKIKI